MRRLVLTAALAVTLVGSLAGSAATATVRPPPPAATAENGQMHVRVRVDHFSATAAGTKATGIATATLTPAGATPVTISKRVTLVASPSGRCTVLTLTLETLELKLLGLNVHLDKVVLNVTGEAHGGVLGSLFCSLAPARVKAARVAAASRLDSTIRRTGAIQPLGFTAGVRAVKAETPCPPATS